MFLFFKDLQKACNSFLKKEKAFRSLGKQKKVTVPLAREKGENMNTFYTILGYLLIFGVSFTLPFELLSHLLFKNTDTDKLWNIKLLIIAGISLILSIITIYYYHIYFQPLG